LSSPEIVLSKIDWMGVQCGGNFWQLSFL